MPPLLDMLKDTKQCNAVLPNVFHVLEKENFITSTQFRETFWPAVAQLCQAKELPAQGLYLLLKHADLLLKFVQ
jgi:hypothetical protein